MQYKDVVKAMFAKYKGKMPAKDIMKLAAAEYRKMGAGAKSRKSVRGGSYMDDYDNALQMADKMRDAGLIPQVGAGMRRRGRKAPVRGGGVISDVASPFVSVADSIGSLFGLGLEKKKGKKKMPVRGGGVISDVASPFVDVADSIGSLFGLGLEKKKGKKKGGYLSAGALSAGDIEPQAMTPGVGAFSEVPFNPTAMPLGGGINLGSVAKFLPMLALL